MLIARRVLRSPKTSFSTSARPSFSIRHASSSAHSETVSILPPRLDYKPLLSSLESIQRNATVRNASISVEQIAQAASLATRRASLINESNVLKHQRSIISNRVRNKQPGAVDDAKRLKKDIQTLMATLADVESSLLGLSLRIPNDTHPDSPLGPEKNAKVVATLGPEPLPADPNRDHLIIGRQLGVIDFESASIVTGSNWYFLRGAASVLEQALQSYALSVAVDHGFTPASCPDVVRADIAARCGFSPRDRDGSSQAYQITSTTPDAQQFCLAATAEIPLAGSFFDRNFFYPELPQRVVGIGKAYRPETSGGTDVRGLYRVHQFSKIELFVVSDEQSSEREFDRLVSLQKDLVAGLGLTVRVLDMPSEELGASAYRKFDMEAWMPGKATWGEISSTSNCTSYQARRLLITYNTPKPALPTDPADKSTPSLPPTTFAHTLNGTAAAIPRLIVALLENGVVLSSAERPEGSLTETVKNKLDSRRRPMATRTKGARKETLDEGIWIEKIKLPTVLRRFWIGKEQIGDVDIEWV
ncbi:seryl-trna synthetase [Phaffia rhodozyma]|uniref:serine--tRNA ligase n=1 Tax=Phaffia rhodozyma TaxID=264483 RepID=A0A0F7SPB0_PHARH|nr:seryl-trna synthetase [Phaffia rhodozyma]